MKRRTFALASTSMLALMRIEQRAYAQAPDFATLSKTTLTPVGAERAANAAGTIPAWTGGMTSVPEGVNWDPSEGFPPDFWADESALYTVDSSNMAKYVSLLSEGVQTLIQKQGFSLKVYPTHRTAAAPQWVYDNVLANSTRAQLDPAGGRLGFTGAYGGIPFPIPDVSNPLSGGAQVVWNHITRWIGSSQSVGYTAWAVTGGQGQLANKSTGLIYSPYYQQTGSLESYNGFVFWEFLNFIGPANEIGEQILSYNSTNTLTTPNVAWELLPGQGRVRKAPELTYDTPDSNTNDIGNYDEFFGFYGALDKYDWKLIGKQEMLIPYNNNKLAFQPVEAAHGPKFLDPDAVRWELHRVWVVDATLHPGERNVLAHRRFYIDEDTWTLAVGDCWDANGNLYHLEMTFNSAFPNVPCLLLTNNATYNLQTGDYCTFAGPWQGNNHWIFGPVDMSKFEPQAMAASASY